jgi:uncharacterized membrane protein
MAVEEIFDIVDSQLHLTFDYIAFTVLASIIAGVGLATGSAVTVVAAMILDPFMGPILGMTFGTTIRGKIRFQLLLPFSSRTWLLTMSLTAPQMHKCFGKAFEMRWLV